MKFARTIRFDKSDLNIFPLAAEEGELALVGTFSFSNIQNEDLKGKVKQAFSNGFIGCSSFGYSTLVSLVKVNEDDLINLQHSLGKYFMEHYGATSKIIDEKVASEEINVMSDLCKDRELGSLLSISREWSEEGIKERFRNLPKADSCAEQKIWTVVDED